MDFLLAQDYATSLFLHIVRVGAFFAVVPIFGRQVDSMILRLVLAVSLAAVFWWVGDQRVSTPHHLFTLGVMAVREGVVGIALGFAMATMTSLLVSAGETISSEMGFTLARTINPESGVDATVVSQFLQVFGFLLILHFDLHHEALRVVEQTFHSCPVGQPFDLLPIWEGLKALVGASVQVAVQYSFPLLGIMLLLSVGMVLLGRAVPAINLMEFVFALRVLLALGALSFLIVEGTPFLLQTFHGLLDGARAMFP
ncbi:MAG TPA: flagellar biosynthetic protein FliR [Planctomycetota bacterium]|nr:flagellar biosynthetic protein FliR [Planctomycetota bacterium]